MADEPKAPSPADLGARQVRAVMISLMGSVILAALLGGTELFGALFWIAILAFLWLSLSAGRGWARWVVVGLIALLGVGNAYQAVSLLGAGGLAWTINAGLVVVFAWCAFVLVMSDKVQAYLAAKRESSSAGPPPEA